MGEQVKGINMDDGANTSSDTTPVMKKWISRYKVVSRKTIEELEHDVGDLIDHGFIPLGGVISHGDFKEGRHFAQALLKSK